MSTTWSTNLGQVDNAGADDALFKTVFSGLVMREYERLRVVSKMIKSRTLKRAKSATFRLMGSANAVYHVKGESILTTNVAGTPTYLSQLAQAEIEIFLNDKLLSTTTVDELDRLKNEFDDRKDTAAELARALADRDDQYCIQALIAAAGRTADAYTGEPAAGGSETITAWATNTFDQNAELIFESAFAAKKKMDRERVPVRGRKLLIHPDFEEFFTRNTKVLNRDWGGAGAVQDGTAPRLAGFDILTSANMPISNYAAETGDKNNLHGDFSKHMGVFFEEHAAGTVRGMEMKNEMEWSLDFQVWAMVAKMAVGYSGLRRQNAVVLKHD